MFFRTAMKISFVLLNGAGAIYRSTGAMFLYAAAVVAGAFLVVEHGIAAVAGSTLVALALAYYLSTRLVLALVGLSWRDLIAVYAPALLLTPIIGGVILGVAVPMRAAGIPAIPILAASGLATAVVLFAILVGAPQMVGRHGQWLLDQFRLGRRR